MLGNNLLSNYYFRAIPFVWDVYGRAFKGESNPNYKYVSPERVLWTMNFDLSIIKISWKWGSYGHLKISIWPTFSRHFEYLISFQNFFNCLIFTVRHWKENLPTDLDGNSFQSNSLIIVVLFLEIETFLLINKPKHLFVITWISIQIYL